MKKNKLLASVLALAMVLSLTPISAFAEESDGAGTPVEQAESNVAKVGDNEYSTLQAAVDAVQDNTETTITLLRDVEDGTGVNVPSNRKIIFDFDGNTYKVSKEPLAGSSGTKSQCFQLLKGSTITMRDGTIVANNSGIAMMIQNYSDLTLDGMTLDATQGTNNVSYVMSNNFGNSVITGNTVIKAKESGKAFDVYHWVNGTYDNGVSVTIDEDMTGTITGEIEVTQSSSSKEPKNKLIIEGGTVNGDITISKGESVSITNATVTGAVTSGTNNKGPVVIEKAEVGSTTGDVVVIDSTVGDEQHVTTVPTGVVAMIGTDTYTKLSDAITAASTKKSTIKLMADVTESVTIPANADITLDLNGKTLQDSKDAVDNATTGKDTITVTLGGTLTIQDSSAGKTGKVDNKSHAKAAIYNNGKVTLEGGTYVRSAEKGESATNNGGNSFYVILNHGVMTIEDGVKASQSGKYSSMIENGYQNYGSNSARTGYVSGTNQGYPTLTIKGGEFSGGINTVKNDDNGKLVIEGGKFENNTQAAFLNWNEATVKGGEFSVADSAHAVILNGSYGADSNDKGKLTIEKGEFTATGSIPVIRYMEANKEMGEIKISGGEFVTGEGTDVIVKASDTQTATIEVSGGNYSDSVAEYVVADKKAELVKASGDAPYSYHANVAAAQKKAGPNDTINDLTKTEEADKTYYTVTLDRDDGKSAKEVYTVESGKTYTVPADPTRSGYTFSGWSGSDGKTYKAGASITVTDNVTLTAQWIRNSSPSTSDDDDDEPTYSVTVPGKIKHGDITVRPKSAEKGDTVTITVDPDEGYEVDEVVVTDRKGNQLKVKDKGSGKYTFTMPASKVEIDVTFVKKSEAPAVRFDDVPKGAWYYDAAIYAAKNGLMSGTGDNMFSPDRDTSRAMIWVMLARLDDQDVSVLYGSWYDKAQAWAVSAGVSDGSAPNSSVTREQLAVMLYSFAKDQGYKRTGAVSLSGYVDAGSVSPWAVDALEWAVGNGLISGTGDGLLAPRATATRAQVAVILMNFCEDIVR